MNPYSNRKFLGPLDLAPIRAYKFCYGMTRLHMLTKMVEEIERLNVVIKKESSSKAEIELAKLILEAMDKQFEEFLGIGLDRNKESSPLST